MESKLYSPAHAEAEARCFGQVYFHRYYFTLNSFPGNRIFFKNRAWRYTMVYMTRRYIKIFFVLCFLSFMPFCHAMEWKGLHEEADKTDIGSALKKAESDPGSKDALYILALSYLNIHKNKQAGDIFDKILSLDPDAYEAAWGRAEVLRRQHKAKESEEIISGILKAHPRFAPANITLASIRYTQLDFRAAARFASRVFGLTRQEVDDGSLVRAYVIYGLAKGMLAHYGGPLSKTIDGLASAPPLKRAEKLRPDDAIVLFGVGSYYLLAPVVAGKDLDKAEKYLKDAVVSDPLFVDAFVRLAQVYKAKGDSDKYREYMDRALAVDPESELALDIDSGACRFVCPAGRD
ncbi:MAG TPA: hypothetical protein DCL35_02010 [Candidatus Omnitrophica bacterium]|nr:hypothetical protein [Candidatus Omnitrophota bacterium]